MAGPTQQRIPGGTDGGGTAGTIDDDDPAPLPLEEGAREVSRTTSGAWTLAGFINKDDELRFSLYRSGSFYSDPPDLALSADTRLDDVRFETIGGVETVVIDASDHKWATTYVWDMESNRQYHRARRGTTGALTFSSNIPPGGAVADFLGYRPQPRVATRPAPRPAPHPAPALQAVPDAINVGTRGGRQYVRAVRSGQIVAELSQPFELDTSITNRRTTTAGGNALALFVGTDNQWRTWYAWDVNSGALYWRAAALDGRRTGTSRNYSSSSAVGRLLASGW